MLALEDVELNEQSGRMRLEYYRKLLGRASECCKIDGFHMVALLSGAETRLEVHCMASLLASEGQRLRKGGNGLRPRRLG